MITRFALRDSPSAGSDREAVNLGKDICLDKIIEGRTCTRVSQYAVKCFILSLRFLVTQGLWWDLRPVKERNHCLSRIEQRSSFTGMIGLDVNEIFESACSQNSEWAIEFRLSTHGISRASSSETVVLLARFPRWWQEMWSLSSIMMT